MTGRNLFGDNLKKTSLKSFNEIILDLTIKNQQKKFIYKLSKNLMINK